MDGPCRERGQWTGDTLAVTLPNIVYCYDDITPARLTLFQTSESADKNGVISMFFLGGFLSYFLFFFCFVLAFDLPMPAISSKSDL